MARKKTEADSAYNVRRRLTRAAERKINEAMNATGARRERLQWQAEQELRKAASTYGRNAQGELKLGKKVKDLFERLQRDFKEMPSNYTSEQARAAAEKAKYRRGTEAQREQSAREIFNSNIGSRIVGAFESVWREDKDNMLEIIKEKVGARDLMEVVEIVEEKVGEALYLEPGEKPRYDEVVELIKAAFNLR